MYAVKVESSRRLEAEDPVVAGGRNFLVGGVRLNVQRTDFCVLTKNIIKIMTILDVQ